MSDPFLRRLAALRHIPGSPGSTTCTTIVEALRNEGYEATERTVQRDLVELATKLPIACDDQHGKPYRWSWLAGASLFDLPGMDAHTALAFALAEKVLAPLLPEASLRPLRRHFERARAVLGRERKLSRWPGKVRVVGRGVPTLTPKVADEVLRCVQLALLEDRCLRATYRRRGEQATRSYLVNPLALVVRDPVLYLVCTLEPDGDPKILLLHRMVSAEPCDDRRTVPAGFDLDRYLACGALGFALEEAPMRLVARFSPLAAPTILEAPLSLDQTATTDADGWVHIEASIHDTVELRMWLCGFGNDVEVLKPPRLRQQTARTLRAAAAHYDKRARARKPTARDFAPGLDASSAASAASKRSGS